MSWPLPGSVIPAGPAVPVPVLQVPWAGRQTTRPVKLVPRSVRASRYKASLRKAKYGSGMLMGLVAVGLAKRILNSIPVLNIITRPVLDLVPTIIAGPAIGAALVYGIEQGDLLAARHVVKEKVEYVRQELDTVVRDLSTPEVIGAQDALESTARVAAQSVAEMERTVVPVIEREFRNIETHARRAWGQGGSGGSGGLGWGA